MDVCLKNNFLLTDISIIHMRKDILLQVLHPLGVKVHIWIPLN